MSNLQTYTQIGMQLSLYSGKTRAYLLHKGIPFRERDTNLFEYVVGFPRRTGTRAIPILITPEGTWLQDSSEIIDELERRFPYRPVLPESPVLRFAAYLFELWGDEFWLPLAMHTRWSHPENEPLFVRDVGDAMLGGMPGFLRDIVGRRLARRMRALARHVGVRPEQAPLLDRFAQVQLDALDAHFRAHPFLFGGRPSLGDFGMIGPLYAHVGRDPWSKRELIDPRPHLKAWIGRMFDPRSAEGDFFADDHVPATLAPAVGSMVDEMVPFIAACAECVRKTPIVHAGERRATRFFPEIAYPLCGGTFRRDGLSYPVWMAQRMLDAWRRMPECDATAVREWLRSVGGEGVLALDLPRVRRVGLAAGRIA